MSVVLANTHLKAYSRITLKLIGIEIYSTVMSCIKNGKNGTLYRAGTIQNHIVQHIVLTIL